MCVGDEPDIPSIHRQQQRKMRHKARQCLRYNLQKIGKQVKTDLRKVFGDDMRAGLIGGKFKKRAHDRNH